MKIGQLISMKDVLKLCDAHVCKLSGFLLTVKSGLFHMGVYLDGARGVFAIW